MELTTTLILVVLGILMEGFFSGSEIGMIAINRIKMKHESDAGQPAAASILNLLASPERLFATTSLGTNLAMVTTSAVFTAYLVTHLGRHGEWLAMAILSPIIIFAAEIVPKMIFQNQPETIMRVM
nr:DUF21 domain-containing protein [Nitrospinaceae bacterium]NIR56601.1 DUF21 domain-containing protein [Nitrospinaceae bacterium]NIS87063.1 DUF21 domain-containing protein [Nitrospinaceae bacterium]NIT83916.1 DUF21 domain-containing protein [Nitrospinaceae bacterium]NIU46110.1 DUF21 domain-containing protein [Nitrospinaceae bacterium]